MKKLKLSISRLFTRLVNWLASRYADDIIWLANNDRKGKEKIRLEKTEWGVYIYFPDFSQYAVAMADTFYRKEQGHARYGQFVIHIWPETDLDDDPIFTQSYSGVYADVPD